jgi:sensor histidine kinase YesM
MNTDTPKRGGLFSGNFRYLIITGIICIPLFVFMQVMVKRMEIPEDEAAATGFTTVFLLGVIIGRYIGGILTFRMTDYPRRLLLLLSIVSLALIFWIFFYSEFPLRDRPVMGLFLFGFPLFILSIIAGLMIKIVRGITQKQLTEAKSSAAHSESELQLLQSQISPHFLFNTLNNMYGLSITQQEKIPPLLLKLSDLLRYSVYDARKSYVPVKDELGYINNYIDFEKMRIGDRLALTTDFEDFNANDARIAPMLLIVFIENAFKHSKNSPNERIFVHISLKTWGNRLLFTCVNSYSSGQDRVVNGDSGFGLDNAKKRLDLLYARDHHLVIEDSDNTYKVMLQLKMK